jgi:hypothetical protein
MQEINTVHKRRTTPLDIKLIPYQNLFVETVFYKNSKYAHWFVLLFFLLLFSMFYGLLVFDNYVFPLVVLVLLVGVPIFSAFSKRGWFSFAAMDARRLIIDIGGIQIGEEYFEFSKLTQLHCQFDSFCNLKVDAGVLLGTNRKSMRFEDGNKNELEFTHGTKKYYLKFVLRNKAAYEALRSIIQYWITVNDHFTAREKYPLNIIELWN